jgi:hypothetical protein
VGVVCAGRPEGHDVAAFCHEVEDAEMGDDAAFAMPSTSASSFDASACTARPR